MKTYKKLAGFLLAAVLIMLMGMCVGCKAEEKSFDNMANPWTTSDRAGVLEATGFEIDVPDGAQNVEYSYMKDSGLAQVTYEYDFADWTYRIQPANEPVDISGMYYDWNYQEDGKVAGRDAQYYAYVEGNSDDGMIDSTLCVHMVNWYDVVPGVAYSLTATAEDLNGMDIQAFAENIFVPLQE